VIAATNRPDVLDQAPAPAGPVRSPASPAREPDRQGRKQILEVHTRSDSLGADVDLGRSRPREPGHGRRDLANLVNEGRPARAPRRSHDQVTSRPTSTMPRVHASPRSRAARDDEPGPAGGAPPTRGRTLSRGHVDAGRDPVRRSRVIPAGDLSRRHVIGPRRRPL